MIRPLRAPIAGACLLLLLLASGAAPAQTACPQGVAPGSPSCGPGGGSGLWTPPPPPIVREPKLHGAIAIGTTEHGKTIGAGQWIGSRRDARVVATNACRDNGGSDCRVAIHYADECASIAYPLADPMATHAAKAEERDEAERTARARCERDGSPCRTAYTHCTDWSAWRNR